MKGTEYEKNIMRNEAALLLCILGVPVEQVPRDYHRFHKGSKAREHAESVKRLYPSPQESITYFRTGNLVINGQVIYQSKKNTIDDTLESYLYEKTQEETIEAEQLQLFAAF